VTEKSEESHEIPNFGSPLEISQLKYHKGVFKPPAEFKIPKENSYIYHRPIIRTSFTGKQKNPKGGKETICRDIDPRWVEYYFNHIFVNLVMLHPEEWIPVPIGSTRPAEEKAPETLLVRKVRIPYQQFDHDRCLPLGMASCLDYCGERAAARQLSNEASEFEILTRDFAIKRLKKSMLQFIPCIGDCTIFNVRNAKKRSIRKLSIEDLITEKTRFPTVIIPLAKDGSFNHAVVVIDDIIFDSTQAFALKLCHESLDWICGDKGIASIYIGLRFNRANATKDKLQHVMAKNW
jgi:hypothetical protein